MELGSSVRMAATLMGLASIFKVLACTWKRVTRMTSRGRSIFFICYEYSAVS